MLPGTLLACSGGGGGSPCGPTRAQVARVIDGDTIELASGERVRYLLVDTPESTGGATDCFGVESATLNGELVAGKEITLDYDEAQCEDAFGRALAYVSVDGREVNSLLVERGYACVLYIPPAGGARADELFALEAAAKAAQKGMWGACQVVTCD
jgi:micrococcal nuclease